MIKFTVLKKNLREDAFERIVELGVSVIVASLSSEPSRCSAHSISSEALESQNIPRRRYAGTIEWSSTQQVFEVKWT